MKLNLSWIILILIILCFLCVYLFTMPALFSVFNIASDHSGNIGSAIGGITAPVIGIVSSILLYSTLIRQIEGNEKAKIKNESDIIFLMLAQFDSEYDRFYYKYSQGEGKEKVVTKFTGIEAIHEFVNDFAYEWTYTKFEYGNMFQATQLSLLIQSFKLVDKRVSISQLDSSLKEQFEQKLKSIYLYKFHKEVSEIIKKCDKLNKEGELIQELKEFQNTYSKKYIK